MPRTDINKPIELFKRQKAIALRTREGDRKREPAGSLRVMTEGRVTVTDIGFDYHARQGKSLVTLRPTKVRRSETRVFRSQRSLRPEF